MKTKVRKTYNYLIRILIILATYGFIYQQVFHKHKMDEILESFDQSMIGKKAVSLLLLVCLLMLMNWSVEAVKWKLLINKIEKISWLRSFKAVLTGIAVSSFTPNRVGDYFGRVFILEKANRIEGVFITILGSMSQLLVTYIIGTASVYIMFLAYPQTLLDYLNIPTSVYGYFLWGGAFLLLGIDILLIALFLNISVLSALSSRFKGKAMERLSRYIRVLSAYSTGELLVIIMLSFSRFIIFSIQMYLLLRVFGVNIPFLPGMVIIAVIFFVMTVIPTVAITELGIRGSVALFLVGVYFGNPLELPAAMSMGIVAASTALWVINLAIPALAGATFAFNLKFFRKSSHD